MTNNDYEVIFAVVNSGYAEDVMDVARKAGARGGTIINARGVVNESAASFFGITMHSEKEIVMILVDSSIKNDILHALYQAVGLKTPGQGIAFAMPVEDVVGLSEAPIESFKSE